MDLETVWASWRLALLTGVGLAVALTGHAVGAVSGAGPIAVAAAVVVPATLLTVATLVLWWGDVERTAPLVAAFCFGVAALVRVYVTVASSPVVTVTPAFVLATIGWLVVTVDRSA